MMARGRLTGLTNPYWRADRLDLLDNNVLKTRTLGNDRPPPWR